MRSKSFLSAAIAFAVCSSFSWFAPSARAADPKSKAAADKKKAAELHADEKSMKKQLQWEDKVMGPDDKRAELDKIARAHAINEKAEKEKERQAALEPAPAPAPAKTPAKKNEVAIPSTSTEKPSAPVTPRDISAALASEAARAPVAPTKPADDKFIDKLLKEERTSSKKKTNASDKELEGLLAGVKSEKRGKKGDSVDDLLKSAEKGPAMPAPRASAALPEWTKTPDIAPSAPPPPSPVAAKPAAKKNDGIIQVVQGAATSVPTASFAPAPPPPSPPVAARPASTKKAAGRVASAKPADWNDPFADKKSFAPREDRFTPAAASVTRKEPAPRPAAAPAPADWNDPFADAPEPRKAARRAAPAPAPAATAPAPAPKRERNEPAAHPPGWKDPFTKAPAEPTRAPLAMRELGKNESSKWELAARHAPPRAAASDAHPAGGWSVLKKRPR